MCNAVTTVYFDTYMRKHPICRVVVFCDMKPYKLSSFCNISFWKYGSCSLFTLCCILNVWSEVKIKQFKKHCIKNKLKDPKAKKKASPLALSCFDGELKMPHQNLSAKQRDWKFVYTMYKPTEFTQCISDNCDPESPKDIKFKQVFKNIDRRTAIQKNKNYKVKNGYPLNPAGRTGVAGRGFLPRWGPNHLMQLIFTKKIKMETFYLVKLTEGKIYFPEDFVEKPVDQWFAKKHTDPLMSILARKVGSRYDAWDRLDNLKKNSRQMLSGSIPSMWNTDNAWIEMHIKHIKCAYDVVVCEGIQELLEERGYNWLNEKEFKKYIKIEKIDQSDVDMQNVNPNLYTALFVNSFVKYSMIAIGLSYGFHILLASLAMFLLPIFPIMISVAITITLATVAGSKVFKTLKGDRQICPKRIL